MKKILLTLVTGLLFGSKLFAQAPGCPNIVAQADVNLPCSTPCTNLTATPFHVGNTSTYTVAATPYAPVIPYNQAGGTAVSANTDDVYSPLINLPFPFCYYGNTYNSCVVGSNGNITFNPANANGYCPWSFTANCPSPALPLNSIFGVFHDVDPSICGNIRWHLIGTAPCRMFVVNFNNICHYSCGAGRHTSSQIVLYETTNVIEVYTNQKETCAGWNGGRAIIGIQNATGAIGLAAPGRNTTPTWTVNAGEGWRFTPNGAPTYNVAWFQGATQIGTGNTINVCPVASPTTYTAQVTYTRCDGVQIIDSDNVVVTFNALPLPTVTPVAETCNGYNNGSVTINNAVGSGPYTVSITGPTNPPAVVEPNTAGGVATFTNLADGIYNYTVVAANGCTVSGTFTINPGPVCCSVTANGTNVTCNAGTNGTVSANPVGMPGFTYSWNSVPVQTSQTATGLTAGTYTVTMTDNVGCIATANVSITQPNAIVANATPVHVTCNGLCNGSISVTAAGGTGALQYQLNGGAFQASNNFAGLCAGNYTIVVRDANNCTQTINVTITQPTALSSSITANVPATCGNNNGSLTAAGSGGTINYQYSINGGSTFQASGTFGSLAPGNYTIIVRDANGCQTTINATVANQAGPAASVGTLNNVTCAGGVNGSVVINAAGGTGGLTFDLNPGPGPQASNSFNNLLAGNYTVVVADANGCTTSVPFTITQPSQLTFNTVVAHATCNGLCNGQIVVTAANATAPYEYSSNGGLSYQVSNTLTGLCAGTINVVVRDANGCLANSNVTITQPAAITGTLVPVNPICQGICNGSVTVSPSGGGTGALQYSINGGAFQAGNSFPNLCSGNQSVIIQDGNGCQLPLNVALVDPPGYTIDTVYTLPSNCGFNDGSFQVVASGGLAPYSYNNITLGASDPNGEFLSLVAGAYQVIVTDGNGCQENIFVGINDVQMSGLLLNVTDATCPGACDGTVSTIATAGGGTITYDLDNGLQTQFGSGDFTGICDGSHAITMTDQGFCVFVVPFNVVAPASINYTSAVTHVSCNGGNNGVITVNAPVGGTSPYTYSNNNGATFQASNVFTGLTAGTYDLVVMDANNCLQASTATITEPTLITFTTTITDLTCNGNNSGTMMVVANGGTGSLQYSNNNGATFQVGFSFFGLAANTYNIVVMDANGCTVTGPAVVNQPAPLVANYIATAANCNGSCDGTIQVNASGGTTPYLYSSNNGVVYSSNSLLSGLCAGTYQMMVKDSNNCVVGSSQNITEPTAITFNTVITPSTCGNPNGTITVTANGGTGVYQYSNDNGVTFQASNVFNGLAATTYDIVVEDANGCQETAPSLVPNEASPVITAVFATDLLCNSICNGVLDITASGGTGALTYDIGGAGQAGGVFGTLCAGNYTITVTDVNGCTDVANATLVEPTALTFTSTPTDLLCNNDNTGEITINAVGGTGMYLYSYDNGVTFSSFSTESNLAAGNYNLIVEDANGCQTTGTEIVNEPTPLAITNQTSTNASCFGTCDGDASVTVSGGTTTGVYTYTWGSSVGGPLQSAVVGLCAGSYGLDISDDNGCVISTLFTINQPPAVIISSYSVTDALCNGACDGTISITGVNTVSYSADNGANFQASPNFAGLCPGVYTIMAQDVNGCTVSNAATILEPTPVVQSAITDITICFGGDGILSADASGGTPPYYFVWNTGDTTQFLNVSLTTPTSFTCTVYDQNGCVSNQQSANVAIIPQFIPVTTGDVSVCPGSPATIIASATLGVPGYTFTWFYGNDTLIDSDTLTFIPNGPTTVTLVAEDDCPNLDTLTINVDFFPTPAPNVTVTPASGCAPLVVAFNNTTNPALVGVDCLWNFGDGTTAAGCGSQSNTYTTPGCYDVTLMVTSPDGCVGDSTFTDLVCVFADPIADFSYNPTEPTILDSDVNFTDESTNGATYVWDFAGLGSSTAQNPSFNFSSGLPGEYIVCLTTTSPEGCVDDTCKIITVYDELLIYVPNAFTPNGDGFNDVFLPIVNGADPDFYELLIFNRWGELVYSTEILTKGWDGTYKGMVGKQDVYVWKLRARNQLTSEDKFYIGHVSLLK